ncbi:hypothetical protein FNV43_RR16055 [Rhamnella rubrinervis]|uniref:Uncharacterized protein n=1 Tax=Rhamnella rubrinervis TaxID=2594499 RepID=A0A8K0EA31_9ROSA|nr:hypothetical protein FNV43_RR16055 [Rhamnella rubrinervis]
MGQSLKKLTPGNYEEKKIKQISPIVEKYYDLHIGDARNEPTLAEFYRAVSETVEEINKKLGNTQFRITKTEKLRQAYEEHHQGKGRPLTREEFEQILKEVIVGTGFTGVGGAKDTLIYIFGVPITSLFIKQRLIPRAIPNEFFIPAITSVTVFFLAKFNKI